MELPVIWYCDICNPHINNMLCSRDISCSSPSKHIVNTMHPIWAYSDKHTLVKNVEKISGKLGSSECESAISFLIYVMVAEIYLDEKQKSCQKS